MDISNLDPEAYFSELLNLNKNIVIQVRSIATIEQQLEDNDHLGKLLSDSAFALVSNIKSLQHYIDNCPFDYEQIIHYHDHYKETVKNFYTSILEFIAAAKALILNPRDYLTITNFTKFKAPCVDLVKAIVAASNIFKKLYYNPDLQLEEEVDEQQQQQQQSNQDGSSHQQIPSPQSEPISTTPPHQETQKQETSPTKPSVVTPSTTPPATSTLSTPTQEKKTDQPAAAAVVKPVEPKPLPPAPTTTTTTTTAAPPAITIDTAKAATQLNNNGDTLLTNSGGKQQPQLLQPQAPSSPLSSSQGRLQDSLERIQNFDRASANIILTIGKIKEAALNGDQNEFLSLVGKNITADIAIVTKECKYKTLNASISQSILSVFHLSRLVLKNRGEQYYHDQLELAVEKVNDVMRKIMYSVKSISKSSINLRQYGVDEQLLNSNSSSKSPIMSPEKPTLTRTSASERIVPPKVDTDLNIVKQVKQDSNSSSSNSNTTTKQLPQPPEKKDIKQLPQIPSTGNDKEDAVANNKHLNNSLDSISKSPSPTLSTPLNSSNENNKKDHVAGTSGTTTATTTTTTTTQSTPSTPVTVTPTKQSSKDEEGKQKTIDKFFSKFVRKGPNSNKKRSPLPFEGSPTNPVSPMVQSPPVTSPSMTPISNGGSGNSSTTNTPQTNHNQPHIPNLTKLEISDNDTNGPISPQSSQPKVSFKNETTTTTTTTTATAPTAHSNQQQMSHLKSPPMSSKKERSFTIGMVSGKHSYVIVESPRSKKIIAHESAKQILSLLSSSFPTFEKELQLQNGETLSKITEQISMVLRGYEEETLTSSSSDSSLVHTPDSHSPSLTSQSTPNGPDNSFELVSPAFRKLYEDASVSSSNSSSPLNGSGNKEYQRTSLRYKMTRKLGTIKKRPNNPFQAVMQEPVDGANDVDITDQLINTTSIFVEESIELVNRCFEISIIASSVANGSETKPHFKSTLDHLISVLQYSFAISKIDSNSFVCGFLKSIKEHIEKMKNTGGKCNTTLVSAATKMYRHQILANLDKQIHSLCHSVRVLAIQLISIVISIPPKHWEISSQLQLYASSKYFVDTLVSLLDCVENKIYIANSHSIQDQVEIPNIDEEDDVNIWTEFDISSNVKNEWISDEGSKTGRYVPRAGTLNKLVESLTQDKQYDISRFTKTFLLTYQSFTNPWKLMEKLIQRYTVPEEKNDLKAKIQLRVVSFIQTWVERNFDDFDDQLIAQLKEFTTHRLLMDDNHDLAGILNEKIKKKESERMLAKDRSSGLLSFTFPELMIPEGQKSPSSLFLLLNESEIARQLTLIEFHIFEKIEPTELLDQSWNRDSLKFKSPNVLELINRANKFSFWVASQILWQDDLANRVKVIEKFILIAKYLRDMNNFNTPLAIFTGLNTASILRLKKTFAQLSPNSLAIYNSFEKLMNSSGSYKNYRGAFKATTYPAVPYLPVILSDLTFMEDGNPDKIGHLINFQKRELICRVISEIQACQQVKYDFPIVEPIHTLLSELPSSSPDELYQLSLLREPRDQNSNNGTINSSMASNLGVSGASGGYSFETLTKKMRL
ncbi:hypothetical protein CYY_004300 [Polysphondylium violaceum]|uniref:Ras guanine nucleotide exchange factor n=1 Tax=Polysphondylium violaceum TaxID=133409 RepID=A0A8J4PX94_9MYCE|nr:hypothetical protein CYY_004300 [Polysphondylium violaceum]